MKKVYLLQEIVPSYRVPVFRRLAALPGVDLTVFYSRPTRAMREESLQNAADLSGFRAIALRLIEAGGHAWQFGILGHLIRGRPAVLIAGQSARLDRLLALALCKLLGIRVLWFLGGVPYADPAKIREYAGKGRLNRWFGRANPRDWLVRRADGLIVYSAHARQFYASQGFDPERIQVAPNAPDTDALEAYGAEWGRQPGVLAAERRRLAPGGEPLVFLLGRLNTARRVPTLLRALARVRSEGLQCALVIVGDGSERRALEAMAASLGLPNVSFEGQIYDERELARYFLVCDLFVTPGVSSLAIKMAMAFGKPVITVDYGLEVHDIVDGINGSIFPIDDDAALAARIREVLGSAERRSAMGREALRTIRERVNINQMITGFQRAIDGAADAEVPVSRASASARDPVLDMVKGLLVVGMLIIHSSNLFIDSAAVRGFVYPGMLGFISGSWLCISGYIIGLRYRSRFLEEPRGITRRLLDRGWRLVAVFVVCNIVLGNFQPAACLGYGPAACRLTQIFVLGDDAQAFEVLLGIGYLLIIAPLCLRLPTRVLAGLALCLAVGLSAWEKPGVELPMLSWMLASGIAGIVLGSLVSPGAIKVVLENAGGRMLAVALALLAWVGTKALFLYGAIPGDSPLVYIPHVVSALSLLYVAGGWLVSVGWLSRPLTVMAHYSLLAYMGQMGILRLWKFTASDWPVAGSFPVSIAVTFCTLLAGLHGLSALRNRFTLVDRVYLSVFG